MFALTAQHLNRKRQMLLHSTVSGSRGVYAMGDQAHGDTTHMRTHTYSLFSFNSFITTQGATNRRGVPKTKIVKMSRFND